MDEKQSVSRRIYLLQCELLCQRMEQSVGDDSKERMDVAPSAVFTRYMNEMMEARQVPREIELGPMLATMSVACGSNVTLDAGGYRDSLNLCIAVVAPSGSNKSQPARETFEPLEAINEEMQQAYRAQVDQARASVPKADQGAAAAAVPRRQLLLGDATPEARNQALAHNPRGLLLNVDELVSLFSNLERGSGKTDAVAQLLTIIDGGSLMINRKGEPTVQLKRPFLSIFGTIQPEIFAQKICSEQFLANGFAQRFLVMRPKAVPSSAYGSMRQPSPVVKQYWEIMLRCIYEAPQPITLTLTPMADMYYGAVYDACSQVMDSLADSQGRLRAAISKMRLHVKKVAALSAMSHMGTHRFDSRVHFADMIWAFDVARRALESFDELAMGATGKNAVPSLRDTLLHLCTHKPMMLDTRIFRDLLNIPERTARRYFEDIKAQLGLAQ